MEKQYLVQKYIENSLKEKKEIYIGKNRECKRLLEELESLENSIKKIEKEQNIEFEIFSPRTAGTSMKGELNLLYKEREEKKIKVEEIVKELQGLEGEVKEFEDMFQELEELIALTKSRQYGKKRKRR